MTALNIAARALTTNLAALQVVGNNIANANTVGYSRQTITLEESFGQRVGKGYFGKGVEIGGVTRAYDDYLTRQSQLTRSLEAGNTSRFQKLQQLEALFPQGEAGLGNSLNAALNAWQDVSSAPTNLTARTVAITAAETFTSQMRDTAARVDELRNGATLQAGSITTSINRLASEIAALNNAIIARRGDTVEPLDLLDARDRAIRELNQFVQTSTVPDSDGSISVFVANSQPLVVGARASTLRVEPDDQDPLRLKLLVRQGTNGGESEVNKDFLGGGEIDGVLKFINEDLTDTQNKLGRLALATTQVFNQQHQLGLDLQGDTGTDFFAISALPVAFPDENNGGAADVTFTIDDPRELVATDYELLFENGADVRVRRTSDGSFVPPLTDPPSPMPISLDGITISTTGGSAVGDRYTLRPFADAARNMVVRITAPEDLAVASPVLVDEANTNSGGLTIEGVYTVAPQPGGWVDAVITFDALGQYSVNSSVNGVTGPFDFEPGVPIVVDGVALSLRGIPRNGDTFTLRPPTGNESMRQNFGNAAALLALRDADVFEGVTLAEGYVPVFSALASRVQTTRSAAEFTTEQSQAAETARANKAGVNLDEEAARLLQFQQAYQAAAKALQVAQTTFDTLLNQLR
jgi:flagellar hook-associated protein 1